MVKFEGRIREPLRDVGGTIAAGEQGVMADAMEPLRENVDEESANELVGIERHRFVAAGPFDPIILPLEHNASVIGGDQPTPTTPHPPAVGMTQV